VRLDEAIQKRSDNLQVTRFFAAVFVIVAHAYILCTGTNKGDWFVRITDGQVTMGFVAVSIFFFCGGLLIAKSAERTQKAKIFFVARAKKIFPPLFAVTISSMVLGCIITELDFWDYWKNSQTWRYLLNSVLLLQHDLPRVFEHAPYVSTVNGSLWTLPVEFLCYIGCFFAYKISIMKKSRFFWTLPAVILVIVFSGIYGGNVPLLKSMVSPLVFFYAGMLCYVYREYIILKWQYACVCIILLLIASKLHILTYGLYVLFPYILLVFWYNCRPVTRISVLGNFSYGMYLWAYPIQQTFILASGNRMSPISNIILSLPMAIIMGMVTFYAIEKPMDVRSIKH